MKQTELVIMQDVISFESYDRWLSDNAHMDTAMPLMDYVRAMCEEQGYEPLSDDMSELISEVLFCIEQYSPLLYAYYRDACVSSMDEANAVSIMATLANDMNNDLGVI